MFISNKIILKEKNKEKALFAIDNISKDEIILEFEKNFIKKPTRTSMQITDELYQESTDLEAFENFLNHSCEPNSYIDFNNLTLKARSNIKKGEEITYNYLTTEWELTNKFECKCGSRRCYGNIKGFRYLTFKQQKELEPFLSPFLRAKLKEIEKKNKFQSP